MVTGGVEKPVRETDATGEHETPAECEACSEDEGVRWVAEAMEEYQMPGEDEVQVEEEAVDGSRMFV